MEHFTELFSAKSTDDLLKIVTTDRDSYQEGAVKIAEDILKERGVHFDAPAPAVVTEENDTEKVSRTIEPFILAGVMIPFAFFDLPIATDYESALVLSITLNVFMRFIAVARIFSFCERYNLKKSLWIILGLLFGGWALLAIGIAIWTITEPDPKEETIDLSADDQKLESCPACNFKLNNESTCPDCGLALE